MQFKNVPTTIAGQLAPAKFKHQIGIAIVLLRGDEILVGKRTGTTGSGSLSLPGGHLEENESISDCALRELYEECGITLGLRIPPPVPTIWVEELVEGEVFLTVYLIIFVPPEISKRELGIKNMEPDKCAGWQWVEVSKLVKQKLFCNAQNAIQTLRSTFIVGTTQK